MCFSHAVCHRLPRADMMAFRMRLTEQRWLEEVDVEIVHFGVQLREVAIDGRHGPSAVLEPCSCTIIREEVPVGATLSVTSFSRSAQHTDGTIVRPTQRRPCNLGPIGPCVKASTAANLHHGKVASAHHEARELSQRVKQRHRRVLGHERCSRIVLYDQSPAQRASHNLSSGSEVLEVVGDCMRRAADG